MGRYHQVTPTSKVWGLVAFALPDLVAEVDIARGAEHEQHLDGADAVPMTAARPD